MMMMNPNTAAQRTPTHTTRALRALRADRACNAHTSRDSRCYTGPTGGRTQTAEIGVDSQTPAKSSSRERTQTQTTVHKYTGTQ